MPGRAGFLTDRRTVIWIVIAVLVVGTAIGVASTLRLTGWPSKPVADALPDRKVLTLSGKVRVIGEPLISPLSARSCVMYETFASLYEWPKDEDSEGPKEKALAGQISKREMRAFELVTTVGVVSIDATDADLELAPTPVFPRFPEREARFLREHDKDERLIENATFEEVTVDPDSLVSVRGLAIVGDKDTIRLVQDGDNPIVIGVPRASAISQ